MDSKDKKNTSEYWKIVITRLLKLLTVKSIVTLALTFTFVYLSVQQIIEGDKFYHIFMEVITFYFGTQVAKGLPKEE